MDVSLDSELYGTLNDVKRVIEHRIRAQIDRHANIHPHADPHQALTLQMGGLVILLYKLLSRTGAGGSEKGSRRAMPVR